MYLRLLLRFQSSEDRLCFSLQVFFFFFFFLMQREACRAGSGRAGPGTTHRLHVILQGGVWLKGLFPNTGLQHSQSWAPLTKPRFFSSLLSLHIWDFNITCAAHSGQWRAADRNDGRRSVCAEGGEEGCSSWGGERKSGWCSDRAGCWRQGTVSFPLRTSTWSTYCR